MNQRILIIEDDSPFRKIVSRILSRNGYEPVEAATGKAGILNALDCKPDLVILDLVLPGLKGMEVCQQLKLRPQTASIPILILTGNDREGQEIACLDVGADDYLTKPVKTDRLLAHLRALLRRSDPAPAQSVVSLGPLRLDYGSKLVLLEGVEHPQLTPKEFGMLYELARCSPEPMDRTALYEKVWGIEPPSPGSLKTVDVHARRIRLKMGWAPQQWLSYVSGRGYRLSVPRPSQAKGLPRA